MGYAAKDERKYEVQSLKPNYRAMARAVAFHGKRPTELAEMFGYTVVQITNITQSALFKAEVKRLEIMTEEASVEVATELKELAGRAVEIVAAELHNPNPSRHQTETAFKVLDRTGFHPKSDTVKTPLGIQIINYTPLPGESPADVEQRLAGKREEVIEGEFEDVP